MHKIYLGLAIHNHQPGDNFSYVFEKAYNQSYLPLVEALENHPGIRLSLHYSGCLLDWLIANRPDFIDRIAALVKRGQVEIMSGGYYEPILPMIPDSDKLGQINRLSAAVEERFGHEPTGMWLAERVWEPQLPKTLAQAGIKWTVVDDNHFKTVGLYDGDMLGYYVTEEEGRPVKVFASSKKLRYLIPWWQVKDVIEYLKSLAEEGGDRIIMMGDDGEKFGLWPGTYKHCWEDGWMEQFFTAVEENSDWLRTIPLGEYAEQHPPLGRVYLPTASYSEMQEWSLPPAVSYDYGHLLKDLEAENQDDILRYVHAGFWRSFMAKYPEINSMQKKMLRAHDKVYRARELCESDAGLDELWRAQCNCPYWHGVFGGIYFGHIRHGIFRHLISAENAADEILFDNKPFIVHETTDFDSDAQEELLIESDKQNVYIDPNDGGSIFEWDLRRPQHNLGAVMTRRDEAYHRDLIEAERIRREGNCQADDGRVKNIHDIIKSKQEDLDKLLFYDNYRRASLIDRFLPADTTVDSLLRGDYQECGDFVGKTYECSTRKKSNCVTTHLVRDGHVKHGDEVLTIRVEKTISLTAGSEEMEVTYLLTNTSGATIQTTFASEWNLALTEDAHCNHCSYTANGERKPLARTDDISNIDRLRISDPHIGIDILMTADRSMKLRRYPIECVTNSEDGFELTFQGSCFILGWDIAIEPGQEWELNLKWQPE
ncbi:MAG: alpha-amylase/4-alpha-glucanotransferase domain-containing protein [Dehalococcoidia bacterium]